MIPITDPNIPFYYGTAIIINRNDKNQYGEINTTPNTVFKIKATVYEDYAENYPNDPYSIPNSAKKLASKTINITFDYQ